MTTIKLTYFDLSGNRGEECRLALHLAGLDFEDHRINREQFAQLKPSLPFGSVPVVEIEGKGTLAQTNAILRYFGAQHGLHPSDPFEAARHDAIMDAVEDARGRVAMTMRIKDADERKAAREELCSGYLATWAEKIEAQLGAGPFVAGDTIQVADIKVYMMTNWIAKGILDHIPVDLFDRCSALIRLRDAVADHPKVVEWSARSH